MKLTLPLQLLIAARCSTAASLVIPESPANGQQAPIHALPHNTGPSDNVDSNEPNSWWESLLATQDSVVSAFDETVDRVSSGVDHMINRFEVGFEDIQDQLRRAIDITNLGLADHTDDATEESNGGHHHHDFSNYTIYQLISLSNYTTKFAKLVNEYPDVVELLNSTKTNHTLFVPVDEAFDDIPEHHKKPSKEFIEDLLKYHIGLGNYPAKRILFTNTLPTAMDEEFLGGDAQRLRTSVGLTGVRVNFYSKVVAVDMFAKNGVIHAVRSILVPPPFLGRLITLFPSRYSTLLLAYEKTDFVKYLHGLKTVGTTFFVPTNNAFAWLGPRVNAFLFNTETGLKYLTAILKYHIAPNATLYSDAFYDKTGGEAVAEGWHTEHFDLATLLDNTHVGVDIASLGGLKAFRINGFTRVSTQDAIGKNGVIHVTDSVLIPPRKHGDDHDSEYSGSITVEDLKERLADYVQ